MTRTVLSAAFHWLRRGGISREGARREPISEGGRKERELDEQENPADADVQAARAVNIL